MSPFYDGRKIPLQRIAKIEPDKELQTWLLVTLSCGCTMSARAQRMLTVGAEYYCARHHDPAPPR